MLTLSSLRSIYVRSPLICRGVVESMTDVGLGLLQDLHGSTHNGWPSSADERVNAKGHWRTRKIKGEEEAQHLFRALVTPMEEKEVYVRGGCATRASMECYGNDPENYLVGSVIHIVGFRTEIIAIPTQSVSLNASRFIEECLGAATFKLKFTSTLTP